MATPESTAEYDIYHLPPESPEWAGLLAQFTLALTARDGRAYAGWAAERFTRAYTRHHGLAALADGRLLGVIFLEPDGATVEITFPWTIARVPALARDLVDAAVSVIRDEWPDSHDLRFERQLLPDPPDVEAVTAAGFECHWRKRMSLELDNFTEPLLLASGYRLATWNIRDLDAAARVIFDANAGSLDARLYAAFFGASAAECRRGLLAILAGRYGPVHQQATLCAFEGNTLAGVNFVIGGEGEIASVIELSVDPAHRRRGLGRALMVGSLRVLRDERFARVELAVTAENSALRLYKSLGFLDVGQFAVCVLPASPRLG